MSAFKSLLFRHLCRNHVQRPPRAGGCGRRNGLSIVNIVALCSLFLPGYSARADNSVARSNIAIKSIYTDLSAEKCREEIDKSDPNETPHRRCPGVAGYTLIMRLVDSGRESIDIIDPKQHVFPLNYDDFITRYMFSLSSKAEWRVRTDEEGKQVPMALIVRVQAHEDSDNPEKVTHFYFAVAKITSNESCVTDRILENTRSAEQVRQAADLAQTKPCTVPQPPMTNTNGEVIR